MSCEQIRELLLLHVSDDLDTAEAAMVEGHLVDCFDCQATFERQKALFVSVGDRAVGRVPASTRTGLKAGILGTLRDEGLIRVSGSVQPDLMCETVLDLLLLDLSGDLEGSASTGVARHLADCADCATADRKNREVFAHLAERGRVVLGQQDLVSLRSDILDTLRAEGIIHPAIARPVRPSRAVSSRRFGGGILAACLLVGAFFAGWFAEVEGPVREQGSDSVTADGASAEDETVTARSEGEATGGAGIVGPVRTVRAPDFALSSGRSLRRLGREDYLDVGRQRADGRRPVQYRLDEIRPSTTLARNVDF